MDSHCVLCIESPTNMSLLFLSLSSNFKASNLAMAHGDAMRSMERSLADYEGGSGSNLGRSHASGFHRHFW